MKLIPRHSWRTSPAETRYVRTLRAWCEYNIARYAEGADWLTPEWHRLDDDVTEAARGLSRRRMLNAEQRVLRQLDYLYRTGQA